MSTVLRHTPNSVHAIAADLELVHNVAELKHHRSLEICWIPSTALVLSCTNLSCVDLSTRHTLNRVLLATTDLELVYNVAELGHHLPLQGHSCHGLTAGVSFPEPPQNGTGPVPKGWV